jgi:hypothetical protein
MSENTVSVYVPALDKPLDYDESWSMGHAVWDNTTCSYKAALCKIISEVAAVCINRSWNMKDSSYVYQSLFFVLLQKFNVKDYMIQSMTGFGKATAALKQRRLM